MSYKKAALYPAAPTTQRGVATHISASKEKIVYASGKSIFIRDISNPGLGVAYSGHVHPTTVARISPTGYYCASADITGTVRIWDTVGEDQTLKGEYKALSGRVNDLEWDGESKRIIAVGDGKDKFGHAFMFDSGTSTGEIIGHSKAINAVSIRAQRPFRAATAGDDNLIVFHQGVPFKYVKNITTHTKFVQDVRYAPSGDHFASVGSDGKLFLYDGKEGDVLGDFGASHTGSVFGLSWSPDSKAIATASADRTVKLWDIETKQATTAYTLGTAVDHQQVGTVWSAPNTVVSLAMSGDLNVFDTRAGDKPAKVLYAPQKSVTAATPLSSDTFVVGTADGRVLSYDAAGDAAPIAGTGHKTLVSGLAVEGSDKIFSAAYDDTVREISAAEFVPASFSTASQPRSIAAAQDGTVFVAEANGVEAVRANQKVAELKPKASPTSIAASGSLVAVGSEDSKATVYKWDGKSLSEAGVLTNNKGAVSALAFSPDGSKLAAGDSSGKIVLYDATSLSMITARWSFHNARVLSLHWTPDGTHCASGSLDTHVYVWSVVAPMKNIAIKNAVPGGANTVFWLKGGKVLAASGADACVRTWEITYHK
ncbi:WD40 repeat-like protein [Peniophora sp. CONT]|nr:WD40 repeat-like protein [Peniophora sp. CONT]